LAKVASDRSSNKQPLAGGPHPPRGTLAWHPA
jgi:hypothetical protein